MASTEESWTSWLCDLEAEDYSLINQTDATNSSGENSSLERPAKILKTDLSPSSYILSSNDDNVNPPPPPPPVTILNTDSALNPKSKVMDHGAGSPMPSISKGSSEKRQNESRRMIQESKNTGSVGRSPHQAQDHIIAERMRREKISMQFIALSALIPDLKKIDKASVLGDAIKYVKQLQEQVKVLEEQNKRKSTVESVVFVKKSHLSADEDVSETSSNSGEEISEDSLKTNRSLPEVEARVSEKNVLIRIHCEKKQGVLVNILREIEKLHLSVINSSVLLFGTSILDMTIIAQTEDEFSLSVMELARHLRVGLLQFL